MRLYPEAIKKYPRSMQIIIKRLVRRCVRYNKNALVVVVGETGSSKSYTSLALMLACYEYRLGYTPDYEWIMDHMFSRALDFMNEMKTEDHIPGYAWMWDETGIDAGNKESMGTKNKAIGWYAQTCRSQNQIVFFTVPAYTFLDAQVRKLMHFNFEACGIDRNKKVAYFKPFRIQYNSHYDKVYRHYIRNNVKGGVEIVQRVEVPLIPKGLASLYEEEAKKFKHEFAVRIAGMLENIETKNAQKNGEVLRPQHERYYAAYFRSGGTPTKAAELLGVKQPTVTTVWQFMDRTYKDWRKNDKMLPKTQLYSKDILNRPNFMAQQFKMSLDQKKINNKSPPALSNEA